MKDYLFVTARHPRPWVLALVRTLRKLCPHVRFYEDQSKFRDALFRELRRAGERARDQRSLAEITTSSCVVVTGYDELFIGKVRKAECPIPMLIVPDPGQSVDKALPKGHSLVVVPVNLRRLLEVCSETPPPDLHEARRYFWRGRLRELAHDLKGTWHRVSSCSSRADLLSDLREHLKYVMNETISGKLAGLVREIESLGVSIPSESKLEALENRARAVILDLERELIREG